VVCAALPAAKWLANKEPEKDKEEVEGLAAILCTLKTPRLVLISTIDVYKEHLKT